MERDGFLPGGVTRELHTARPAAAPGCVTEAHHSPGGPGMSRVLITLKLEAGENQCEQRYLKGAPSDIEPIFIAMK